jgi:hypothetical protein
MNLHPTDRLPLFAAGELPSAEGAEVERHLAGCAACRATVEETRAALDLLGGLPPSEATFADLLVRRSRTRDCEELSEALTVHALGEPDGLVERHEAACPACEQRIAVVQEVRASLDLLPPTHATFASLRDRLRPSVFRRMASVAAAAGLIAALAVGTFLEGKRGSSPAVAVPAPSPVASLLARIDSTDDDTLRAAAKTLDRQNVLHALQLAGAMEDEADSVRLYAAVRLLRHLETPAAEDLLVRGLGKSAARDRILVRALVELQSPLVVPWLLARLENPATRTAALDDLARIRDRSTIASIAEHLPDARVAERLARFEPSDLLREAEGHPQGALFVLVPSAALQARLAERASADPGFRAAALATAAEGGAAGMEFLVKAAGDPRLQNEVVAMLDMLPSAEVERAVERALDREDTSAVAVRIADALRIESLRGRLRRAVFAGRLSPEATLPVLARLGDLETLIAAARLRTHDRWKKAATAALEAADPALRAEALAAAAGAEEKVTVVRLAPLTRPGRFRRETP